MTFRMLLLVLVSASSLVARSDPPPDSLGLNYNLHMSDCENRWVVLSHKLPTRITPTDSSTLTQKPDLRCTLLEVSQSMPIANIVPRPTH